MDEKRRYSLRSQLIGYNLTLMISAFVLCGVIFLTSVAILVGGNVKEDINFLLTATADSMEQGMDYCADVVTKARKSEILMKYLTESFQPLTEEEQETLNKEFEKQVDISSQNISGRGAEPLVEKVYLFDGKGNFIRSTYYAMTSSKIKESDVIVKSIYEEYQNLHTDYGCFLVDEESFYLVFPVLDERMNHVGRLLFQIKCSAWVHTMSDIMKYEDAFWCICDNNGEPIFGQNTENFQNERGALITQFGNQPFGVEIYGKQYQMHRRSIGMNLELFAGIPENQLFSLLYDSIKVYAVAIVLIAAFTCGLLVYLIYRMTRPITDVTDKLREVQSGKFDTKLPDYSSSEFHEISRVFNEMTAYIDNLIKEVYEKQLSIKDMEMKFLQTQMNPHFMFNILNTIALQAQLDGNADVYRMISSFSQLIQAKIYRDQSEKVKICQELEYVNYYLYLQNYRYGDRLQYEIQVQDDTLTDYYIPKLCIQLIIENAVVHGIEPSLRKGLVKLNIYEEEQKICIDVEDNGIGFPESGEIRLPLKQEESDKSHNHVGLNNAYQIIKLMYGEEYGIRIFSDPGKGSRICIRIPFDDGNREKVV